MSNDSKGNGGSDLDIFEGLGKKALGNSERSPAAPPPPPGSSSHLQASRPMPVDAKKTLLGISPAPTGPKSAPPPLPPQSAAPPPPPQTRPSSSMAAANLAEQMTPPPSQPASGQMRAASPSTITNGPASAKPPPPPPGRGSLPNLAATKSNPPFDAAPTSPVVAAAAPSQHPGSTTQKVASMPAPPPPASTRPGGVGPSTRPAGSPAKANGTKLDMDWDDDQEATHVYDKEKADAEAEAMAAAGSSEALTGPDAREPERASMDAIMSSPPRPSSHIPSAGPAAGTPPPPPPASLSGAFGALGQPRTSTNGSAPPSAKFRSGPPASQSMRSAPPPPPVSQKNPSLTTQPLPPPPPPGQMTTAPMHMPPPPHPPGPRPASMPPTASTLTSAQAPMFPPSNPPMPAAPPHQSVPPQQQQQYQSNQPSNHPSNHPSMAPIPQLPPVSRAMEQTLMTRPAASKAPIFIALGLIAVMAIVGVAVFALMPRTGTLVVNVSDAKGGAVSSLEVQVDGTTKCESAPCIVKDVSAGTHEVKIVAKGYEPPAPRVIVVEARRDVPTDFQLTATKVAVGTGFKVAATNSGVKLVVDNKDIGPLPQEMRDLEPGEHKLRFVGDRYAPLEKTVSVAKDEIVDLGNVTLKVVKGKATIQLGTPGAKVYLVSGTNRKEVPQFPMAIEFDPNEKWELQGTKDGFDPYSEHISFDDGQAEKTFNVTLNPKGLSSSNNSNNTSSMHASNPAPAPAPAPQPVAHNAAPAPAPAPAPAKDSDSSTAKDTTKKDAPAPAGGGETVLKINSLPAASIVLDGKPIGVTPQLHVVVSPGSHTVMFVNSEQSLKKTISVDVKAGETKAAFAKLRE